MAQLAPATKHFLERLAVSLAVFGALFSLASVSVYSVHVMLDRKSLRESDQVVLRELNDEDLFTPIEQKIHAREELISKLKDDASIRDEEIKLAKLYQELGMQRAKGYDLATLAQAEQAFQRAINLDSSNPVYVGDLATLYANAATRQKEPEQRVALWQNSSRHYETAAMIARDPGMRRQYNEDAAKSIYNSAFELRNRGKIGQAQMDLNRARALAPPGSEIARTIDELLVRLKS